MGIFIVGITYIVLIIVYWRGISSIVLLCGKPDDDAYRPAEGMRSRGAIMFSSVMDIIFLRRLLRTNRVLWIGEWIFHASFMAVVLGHLRYVAEPVPEVLVRFNCIGKHAGYILPLSILYILIVRLVQSERGEYFSARNIFLVSVIFLMGVSGVVMRFFIRPDIVDIKYFMIGMVALSPVQAPVNALFLFHYALFLLLLLYLPSHIIAAPIVMMEARRRNDTFIPLGHER